MIEKDLMSDLVF